MRAISSNLKKMPRSGIREIMELAFTHPDTLRLEVGEPGFDTPAHIQEAAVAAMRQGFTRYTPNTGLLSLREAIVAKLQRSNGMRVTVEQLAVTPGCVFALAAALLAVSDPGDDVLIPDPGWPNYTMQAIIAGLRPVYYPLLAGEGFQPRIERIAPLVTPRTRAIITNSPSNPTGAVYSRRAVADLMALAVEHDIYLISDEAYESIVFDGEHVSPAADDPGEHVIAVFGVSKAYAMTGWRIGYYVAPPHLAPEIHKLGEPFFSNACSVAQKAAEAALTGPQACVAEMAAAYRDRRDLVVERLRAHGVPHGPSQGAFYLMLDIDATGLDSYSFARRLIDEEGVAVAPGKTFGPSCDRYIRLSFCADPAVLEPGVDRLGRFYRRCCDR